jgi:hypothetical protein
MASGYTVTLMVTSMSPKAEDPTGRTEERTTESSMAALELVNRTGNVMHMRAGVTTVSAAFNAAEQRHTVIVYCSSGDVVNAVLGMVRRDALMPWDRANSAN